MKAERVPVKRSKECNPHLTNVNKFMKAIGVAKAWRSATSQTIQCTMNKAFTFTARNANICFTITKESCIFVTIIGHWLFVGASMDKLTSLICYSTRSRKCLKQAHFKKIPPLAKSISYSENPSNILSKSRYWSLAIMVQHNDRKRSGQWNVLVSVTTFVSLHFVCK